MLWQYNRMFGSNPPLLVVLLYSMKNVVLQPLAQASSTLFKYPAGVFFIFPSFPIFDAIQRARTVVHAILPLSPTPPTFALFLSPARTVAAAFLQNCSAAKINRQELFKHLMMTFFEK